MGLKAITAVEDVHHIAVESFGLSGLSGKTASAVLSACLRWCLKASSSSLDTSGVDFRMNHLAQECLSGTERRSETQDCLGASLYQNSRIQNFLLPPNTQT